MAHPRLFYAAEFVFGTVGCCDWQITQSEEEFKLAEGVVKVCYEGSAARAHEDLPGFKTFQVSGWLQTYSTPKTAEIDGCFVLFPSPDQKSFDVFAMAYWCLSRQEEYHFAENRRDKFGRFPASASLFHQCGVLDKPVLDIAVLHYLKQLGIYPEIPFATQPSIDVDIAFAIKGRSLTRTFGTYLKSTLREPANILQNLLILLGVKQDPNDTYTYITQMLEDCSEARVFWHCGKHTTQLDKQVLRSYLPFQKAIQAVSNSVTIGIHPSSLASNTNTMQEEKTWLEMTSGKKINSSRQHYILLRFPETYKTLLHNGILCDYSMGYPDTIGFRAGTARPFPWYDSEKDEETSLMVFPFCIMDVTCSNYLNINIEDSVIKGLELKNKVTQTGGLFGFIFHNESLSNHGKWRGWRTVFEAWLK
jgi:hypothetical protein